MIESPQTIQAMLDGSVHDATVAWRRDGLVYTVRVESSAFEPVEAQADDAFEALCRVREQLDPQGWRLGVAGAQIDVWPSGMARDQGGGLRAYRMSGGPASDLVDTFEPVDPATVTSVAEQQGFIEGHYGPMRSA
jgi:hypothetical protein